MLSTSKFYVLGRTSILGTSNTSGHEIAIGILNANTLVVCINTFQLEYMKRYTQKICIFSSKFDT